MARHLSQATLRKIASRFGALSEPNRLWILQLLMDGEKNVSEIVETTGLRQPNVSRHLAHLTEKNLISRRKEGLEVYYAIADDTLGEMCDLACRAAQHSSKPPTRPKNKKKTP